MGNESETSCRDSFLLRALEGALGASSSPSRIEHPPPDWLAKAVVDWEVRKFVGRGGAGFVWRVRGVQEKKPAALKVIPFRGDVEEARLRWLREARLLADLEDPNIVKIYDYGLAPDALSGWLVMEWMEGGSLDKRLEEAGRFEWGMVRPWALQACRGLEAIHTAGLVHRDIKPGNLLLDQEGERLVISDFGLLIPSGENWLTQTRMVNVTPGYAAPERWRNSVSSLPATDQYSLAATLWHLLSGELPLGAFGALPHGVPSGVEPVLRRALSPVSEARYSSVTLFRLALAKSDGPSLRWLWRLVPLLTLLVVLVLGWLAFLSPRPTVPEYTYPRQFESEVLQVVPTRKGFANMKATLQENGDVLIVIHMENKDLLRGQTTIGEVCFVDEQGRVLSRLLSNPFGINGRLIPGAPSQRTEHFGGSVPSELLPRISDVNFYVHPGNWKMEDRHEVFKRSLREDLERIGK